MTEEQKTNGTGEILQTTVLLDRSGITIETDKRGMVCYFSFKPSNSVPKLTKPVITATLQKAGIVQGVIDEEVDNLVDYAEEIRNVVIARGRRPVMEDEGRVEYKFSTDPYADFKLGNEEKGQIDYRDRGKLPFVKSGEVIARLVFEQDPVPGLSVTGKEVEPEFTEKSEVEPGKNVRVENNQFIAQIDGAPKLDKLGRIEVAPEWIVNGDVDMKTGNIHYPGKVKITGTCLPGYEVHADSIVIGGIEAKTIVDAKKSLVVEGGIQGGLVTSGGRLEARFINNGDVSAEGDVEVKLSIVNSEVKTSGQLNAQTIFGGSVAAFKGVTCVNLSSEANRSTVIFGIDPIRQENVSELIRKKIEVEEHIHLIKEKVGGDLEIFESVSKAKEEVTPYVQERDALKQRRDATDQENESALEFFDMRLEELDNLIEPLDAEIKSNAHVVRKVKKDFMNELMELEKLETQLMKLDEVHSQLKVADDNAGFVPKLAVKGKVLVGTRISSSRARMILNKEQARVIFAQRKSTGKDGKGTLRQPYYLAIERL